MKSLRADAESSPVSNILIVVLLAIGLAAFPTDYVTAHFGISKTAEFFITSFIKFAFCGIFIYLSFSYGFNGLLKPKIHKIYFVLPCVSVVVNNFPFVALLTGNAYINATITKIIGYSFYCCSIALFEEIAFRGIVLPLVYLKTKNNKNSVFLAVLISSLIFGGVHLVNLFSGSGVGRVLLQTCYTFLIGGMCGVVLCVTGSVFVPFLLHFIFDFCGMFVDMLGGGNIWNLPTVIITVILGVIVGIYVLILAFNLKNSDFEKLIENNREKDYE